MSITGDPEGPPTKAGAAVIDVLAGIHAAVAIAAALQGRQSWSTGGRIAVSLLDTALASLINVARAVLTTGVEAARYGNGHPSIVRTSPPRPPTAGWRSRPQTTGSGSRCAVPAIAPTSRTTSD